MEYNTMREYKLHILTETAAENLANSDLLIIRLIDHVIDGRMPCARARRVYATLRAALEIDARRYAKLRAATTGEPKERYYNSLAILKYDTFFGV